MPARNRKKGIIDPPHIRKEKRFARCLLIPTITVFSAFMFWPLIYTIYLSFFKWNMVNPNKKFVGFDNYISLVTDPVTLKLLINTLIYILILVFFNFLLVYILAYILSFMIKKFQGVYKALIFIPSIVSLAVGAIIFLWLFNPISGPIAALLDPIGIVMPPWTKTNGLIIFVLSLVTTYKNFGYNLLIMLSGVGAVSNELIEAAKLDKVPNSKIFKDIVVPLSSSTGIYVFIITVVSGLQQVFTPIKILTEGGPNNASSNIIYGVYNEAFTFFQTGRASALSVMTLTIFFLLLFLEFKFVERGIYYEN